MSGLLSPYLLLVGCTYCPAAFQVALGGAVFEATKRSALLCSVRCPHCDSSSEVWIVTKRHRASSHARPPSGVTPQ